MYIEPQKLKLLEKLVVQHDVRIWFDEKSRVLFVSIKYKCKFYLSLHLWVRFFLEKLVVKHQPKSELHLQEEYNFKQETTQRGEEYTVTKSINCKFYSLSQRITIHPFCSSCCQVYGYRRHEGRSTFTAEIFCEEHWRAYCSSLFYE